MSGLGSAAAPACDALARTSGTQYFRLGSGEGQAAKAGGGVATQLFQEEVPGPEAAHRTLSPEQAKIVEACLLGRNVFFTGGRTLSIHDGHDFHASFVCILQVPELGKAFY